MLSTVSISATRRFNEVRRLLSEITRQESVPPTPDSDTVAILRGLFFVHLYGAFEYAINVATQTLLQAISDAKVPYGHLEQTFYTVALDHRFRSIADRHASGKWIGRRELLAEQRCADTCKLNDAVFGLELQNIWYATLVDLFENLGIKSPVLPDPRYRGYIDEVVNKRNAIAHGRESPISVGSVRAADLELRFAAVSTTASYVIGCLEQHLTKREFIDQAYRSRY